MARRIDEIAELYPSVRFGRREWVAVLTARPDVYDAILAAMAKQAARHPIGDTYERDARGTYRWVPAAKEGRP